MSLLVVKRCSLVPCVRVPAQDSRRAYRLLYLAAVRGGVCPPGCPSSVSWCRSLAVPTDEHPTRDKPGHRERYPEGDGNLAPFTLNHDHKIRLDCGIGLWAAAQRVPKIVSVSGNAICRSCFRILSMSCCTWSTLVRCCVSSSVAIVTQLVTHPSNSATQWAPGVFMPHCSSGMLILANLG